MHGNGPWERRLLRAKRYVQPAHRRGAFAASEPESSFPQKMKRPILLVPGERIELPTNGLQNRCSTAELTRLELTAISVARPRQAALGSKPAAFTP